MRVKIFRARNPREGRAVARALRAFGIKTEVKSAGRGPRRKKKARRTRRRNRRRR